MNVIFGIIEDDITLRNSIVDYISLKGYSLAFALDDLKLLKPEESFLEEPDIILLDEHLNSKSGIGEISEIKKLFTNSWIILMTGDTTQDLIIKAIENGASGFLYKPFSLKQIEEVVKNLFENGSYLHPLSATKLIKTIQSSKELQKKSLKKLSTKELEIVNLLISGKSYKEIALLLNKSFHTINYHIKNMYAKFQVNSRAELIFRLNNKKR